MACPLILFTLCSDDFLFARRWELLVQNRAKFNLVEALTWNDYGESTYLGPIKGAQPKSEAWVDGFDHQPLLEINKYYAEAYKTGTYPEIAEDKIFLSARPHHNQAVATGDDIGRPTGGQGGPGEGYLWAKNAFFAFVLAKEDGEVEMLSGENKETFPVKKGANFLKLALATGYVPSHLYLTALAQRPVQMLTLMLPFSSLASLSQIRHVCHPLTRGQGGRLCRTQGLCLCRPDKDVQLELARLLVLDPSLQSLALPPPHRSIYRTRSSASPTPVCSYFAVSITHLASIPLASPLCRVRWSYLTDTSIPPSRLLDTSNALYPAMFMDPHFRSQLRASASSEASARKE